jgi:two-component system response regulator YesN
MKLLIADDEIDVREGIRCLLDWSLLGFTICGEGKNGQDTLDQIRGLKPDIVLMDIRMPRLSGLEVVRIAKEEGFAGIFIIISGFSDFSFAQEAMGFGVTSYLTKPIDEEELEKAVLNARQLLTEERKKQDRLVQYRNRARESILYDILHNQASYPLPDCQDLQLEAAVYQVVLYTSYKQEFSQSTWDFAGILRLANHNHNSLDYIRMGNQNVIILKDDFALRRFEELTERYISQPQKGSPLDALFLTCGRPVHSIEQIHISYYDAQQLMNRRFFCSFNQHVLSYKDMPLESQPQETVFNMENTYSQQISNYIQSGNRCMMLENLEKLRQTFYCSNLEISNIRHSLADIMIQVKSSIIYAYGNRETLFPSNAAIINTIEEKYYLYEILDFFALQFEMCMNAIGSPTRDSILDNILQYIRNNYKEDLKLGIIAELFGYNSSYLGKVFNKTTGRSFNAWLDEIRIENSMRLLMDEHYKVYEIAQLVGYGNVDYFHKKFRKYTGISPAEYRRTQAGADIKMSAP